MTSPEPPSLEPLRPGGSGRAAKLAAVAAVLGGVAIVAAGLLGGRAPASVVPSVGAVPSSPAVSTAASSSPRPSPEPLAPLPTLTVGADDAAGGRILVALNGGIGVVDRASGTVEPIDLDGQGYVIPAGPDGWLCVCTLAPWSSGPERRTVRLVPVDASGVFGRAVLERELVAERRAPDDHEVLSVQATVTRDGATAALGWVARQADGSWRLEIELVPLRPGGASGRAVVADLPADPPIVSADGPLLEFEPAGDALLTGLWTSRESGVDELVSVPRWVVPLDGGRVGDARPLDGTTEEAAAADAWPLCGAEGWARPGLVGAACPDASGRWELRRWDGAGSDLDPISLGGTFDVEGIAIRLDASSGRVIGWDPYGHRLTTVDVGDGSIEVAPPGGGPPDYPASGVPQFPSPLHGSSGALALSRAGDRAFALGEATVDDRSGPTGALPHVRSTGVWVIDLATMRIVDHWPATARFHQVVASSSGREVLVAGLPGVDADGRGHPGQLGSLTIFDAATGDIRLIAGQLPAGALIALP
jgi:hypothetical protein